MIDTRIGQHSTWYILKVLFLNKKKAYGLRHAAHHNDSWLHTGARNRVPFY